MNRNITVKGGVVMRSISHDARRATQDIDLDFIRYPLQDEAILAFDNKLNSVGLVSIQMTGAIEELNQQDYHGRRMSAFPRTFCWRMPIPGGWNAGI